MFSSLSSVTIETSKRRTSNEVYSFCAWIGFVLLDPRCLARSKARQGKSLSETSFSFQILFQLSVSSFLHFFQLSLSSRFWQPSLSAAFDDSLSRQPSLRQSLMTLFQDSHHFGSLSRPPSPRQSLMTICRNSHILTNPLSIVSVRLNWKDLMCIFDKVNIARAPRSFGSLYFLRLACLLYFCSTAVLTNPCLLPRLFVQHVHRDGSEFYFISA